MSIKFIKKSIDQKTRSEDDEKVKKIVEETLKKLRLMAINILENYLKNLIIILQKVSNLQKARSKI
jgi:hypothetical protein